MQNPEIIRLETTIGAVSNKPDIYVLYKDMTELEIVDVPFVISKTEYLGFFKIGTVKDLLLKNLVVENPYAFYSTDEKALRELIGPEQYCLEQPKKPHKMRRTKVNWEEKLRTWEERHNACEHIPKIIVGRESKEVVYARFRLFNEVSIVKIPEIYMRENEPYKLRKGVLVPLKRITMIRTRFYKKGKLIKNK